MRLEKAAALLALARHLAGSGEGLTLDEMADISGVDRRTAERMRDAVRELFPQMEEVPDGRAKRFRIPGGLDGFAQAPTPDELAELQVAIRGLEAGGGEARAVLLRSLAAKIQAALRAPVRRRLQPDVEALATAEGLVLQAGPRPFADARTLSRLREALKALRICAFDYAGPAGSAPRPRQVVPYGILFGRAYYLVGPELGKTDVKLWRFDRITGLALGAHTAGPPAEFSLAAFASRSFGTFQEAPEDVVLRFRAAAVADARRFLFHPTQVLEKQEDGALIVRFRAGGLLELVRHLFTWGDAVEILASDRLRRMMLDELAAATARHMPADAPGRSQSSLSGADPASR